MAEDKAALSAAAKERGNAFFAKKTKEGYEQALAAYKEAIAFDPEDKIFHGNCSACHIEIAKDVWDPIEKVTAYAQAFAAAQRCTELGPTWVKGFVRKATSEFELVQAREKWEDKKKRDEDFQTERRERKAKSAEKPAVDEDLDADFGDKFGFAEKVLDPEISSIAAAASFGACEATCREGLGLEPKNVQLRMLLQSLRDRGHPTDEESDRSVRDQEAAAPFKADGNAAFAKKNFKEAAEHYTKALTEDPFDHVFYSNRSACYAEEQDFEKALRDADKCIKLNPQFAKGFSRQALALYNLGRYPDAETAAQTGLDLDPASAPLQNLLKQAQVETKETPEVQALIHKFRQEKQQDQKMKQLMQGLNMGGNGNFQVFSPGQFGNSTGGLDGLLSGLGGGGGGFGGGGKASMSDDQIRQMARAMAGASASAPSGGYSSAATPASPTPPVAEAGKPTAFAPKS